MTTKRKDPTPSKGPVPVQVVQFGPEAAPLVAPLLAAAGTTVPVTLAPSEVSVAELMAKPAKARRAPKKGAT